MSERVLNVWEPGIGVSSMQFGKSGIELEMEYGEVWIPESSFVDTDWGSYRIEGDGYCVDLRIENGSLTLISVRDELFFCDMNIFQVPANDFEKTFGCEVDISRDESIPDARFFNVESLGFLGCVYDGDEFFRHVLLSEVTCV